MNDPNTDDALDAAARAVERRPLPALAPELERALAELSPAPTRRPGVALFRTLAASVAYVALVVAIIRLRPDMHELPATWLAAAGALWTASFAMAMVRAMIPRRGSMLMDAGRARGIVFGAGIVALSFGLVAAQHGAHSVMSHTSIPLFVDRAWRCIALAAGVAIVPVVLGTIALRRTAPVGERWIAAALGASGGALGGLVLHLHCPVADRWHVGFVHGGAVVLLAGVAAAMAGPKVRV